MDGTRDQYGWVYTTTFHAGDGTSLDGAELVQGASIYWVPIYGTSQTGQGFAICSAASPNWDALRDWTAEPAATSEDAASAPQTGTPEENLVAVTTSFSDLSMDAMVDKTFRDGFIDAFKTSTAAAAGVNKRYVTVHGMRAGSVVVDASVEIPDPAQRTTFATVLSAPETAATVFSALATDYGAAEVLEVKAVTSTPTAAAPTAAPTTSPTSLGPTTSTNSEGTKASGALSFVAAALLAVLVAAALV